MKSKIVVMAGLAFGVTLERKDTSAEGGGPYDVTAKIEKLIYKSNDWQFVTKSDSSLGHYIVGYLSFPIGTEYTFSCVKHCMQPKRDERVSVGVCIFRTDNKEMSSYEMTSLKTAVEKLLSS